MTDRFAQQPSWLNSLATLLLMIFASVPVDAAKPVKVSVTQAIPSEGEQGAVGLLVTVKGKNFAPGAIVKFLKSGSKDTAGVTVTSALFVDAETIDTTIDIDPAAFLGDFDIEVRLSGGGRGKGTELFRVNSSNGGGSGESDCSDGIDNDSDGLTDCEDDDCFTDNVCGQRGGRTPNIPLVIAFAPFVGSSVEPSDLLDDGISNVYVDKVGVTADAGGAHPRRISMELSGSKKRNTRQLYIQFTCEDDLIGNCALLEEFSSLTGQAERLPLFEVIPYDANCPGSNALCPSYNVLTLPPDMPELMSFKAYITNGFAVMIEAASGIGGGTAVDAGRCLSILTPAERAAFREGCHEVSGSGYPFCNTLVTAFDDNPQEDDGNDRWTVQAEGIRALICTDDVPIGTTTLYFEFEAEKK
jgi:hypothetical protein